jgi:small basic protein
MLIVIIGLLLGILIGLNAPILFSTNYTIYMSVGILAAIDSIFGALRSNLDKRFNGLIFFSGFITNTILATFLAFIGDKLGLPLYYAAMFVFGTRLFNNLAVIRRQIISRYTNEKF